LLHADHARHSQDGGKRGSAGARERGSAKVGRSCAPRFALHAFCGIMAAMYGNVGQLIFFFLTLMASVIVGLFTLTYAAHCFLTIVEDTAAGNDEVHWPDQPPTDWYGKPFFLGWLLSLPIALILGAMLLFQAELLEGPLGILPFLLG